MLNSKDFWQSKKFWKSSIGWLIGLFLFIALLLSLRVERVKFDRVDAYTYKYFLFKTASGQQFDEKGAWPNHFLAWQAGKYIAEESKKGVRLDDIVSRVVKLRTEFKAKGSGLEKYKEVLRKYHQAPETLIHLAQDNRWEQIEDSGEDMQALKILLSGGKLEIIKIDPNNITTQNLKFAFFWSLVIAQFFAYMAGLIKFSDNEHNITYIHYQVRRASLSPGAFATFALFSPGALVIIVFQLIYITMYRYELRQEGKKKKEEQRGIFKTIPIVVDLKSQNELLNKLQARVYQDRP